MTRLVLFTLLLLCACDDFQRPAVISDLKTTRNKEWKVFGTACSGSDQTVSIMVHLAYVVDGDTLHLATVNTDRAALAGECLPFEYVVDTVQAPGNGKWNVVAEDVLSAQPGYGWE